MTETVETMPDGRQVKKRVTTTYEDVEPAIQERKEEKVKAEPR